MQDEVCSKIRDWARQGDAAVMELMPLHAPLNNLPGDKHHVRAMMMLSTACLGTTQTVLYLAAGMRLWDADRLIRSVIEGTAKFGYLLERPETFVVRCTEYRDVLPAIGKMKWHAKAEEALKSVRDRNAPEWQAYRELLISEAEIEEIRSAYSRDMRRDIDRRWGFTGLIEAVSKPGGAFGPAGRGLLHGYSVSSYLHHMSYEGTMMPMERDMREEHRREAIELAHAARLIGDSFWFTYLRIAAIDRFFKIDLRSLSEIVAKYEPLFGELRVAAEEWSKVEYGPTLGAA